MHPVVFCVLQEQYLTSCISFIMTVTVTALVIHMWKDVPTWTRIVAAVLPLGSDPFTVAASVLGRDAHPGPRLAAPSARHIARQPVGPVLPLAVDWQHDKTVEHSYSKYIIYAHYENTDLSRPD